MRTVAGRLGHRNAATTLNVDAHFLKQTDRAAADIIGDIIAPRRMIWAFSDESERAATMLFGVLLIEPGAVVASRAALAELRLPGQRSWAAYCETEWSLRAA